MQNVLYSIVFFLCSYSIGHAAMRVALHHQSFADLTTMMPVQITPHVAVDPALPDQLIFLKERTDQQGVRHTRLIQTYRGIEVYGGHVVVHDRHGKRALNGVIYRSLNHDLEGLPAQVFEESDAMLAKFKSAYAGLVCREERITPIVYIDEHQQAVWAYQVSLFVEPKHRMPMRPTAIMNAKTGEQLAFWDDMKSIAVHRVPVHGVGFGGNLSIGQQQYGDALPLLSVLRDPFKEQCYLENKNVRVIDMAYRTQPMTTAMQFDCLSQDAISENTFWTGYSGDGYDESNGGYSPSNDALYVGDVISQFYKKWYGLDVLSMNHKPMQLIMRVHFSRNYENAFWDGHQMTFGDGANVFYPLVSLDVAAHEVSHGFTEQNSNLVYYGQSGGMNEAFSDMASQAVEYDTKGHVSWKIGSDVIKNKSKLAALRFMDHPSRDGRSIEHVSQYKKGMDVHLSSGIYNRFFYTLATTSGWDPRKAFDVMLKANVDYWVPLSTFEEGACGVLDATHDLGYPVMDVEHAMQVVGLENICS